MSTKQSMVLLKIRYSQTMQLNRLLYVFPMREYSSSFAITMNDIVVREKFLIKDKVCEPCFCHAYYVEIC